MAHTAEINERPTSHALLEGVARTLRRLERDIAVSTGAHSPTAARRLATFESTLAKALQAAHMETVQELVAT